MNKYNKTEIQYMRSFQIKNPPESNWCSARPCPPQTAIIVIHPSLSLPLIWLKTQSRQHSLSRTERTSGSQQSNCAVGLCLVFVMDVLFSLRDVLSLVAGEATEVVMTRCFEPRSNGMSVWWSQGSVSYNPYEAILIDCRFTDTFCPDTLIIVRNSR